MNVSLVALQCNSNKTPSQQHQEQQRQQQQHRLTKHTSKAMHHSPVADATKYVEMVVFNSF